jgi:hydrogenase-4 membrane subunit HyfE
MWQTRSGAGAMAVELAGALLLAVAVSDALGLAAASFYLLVLGVPVTAGAGLICFARVVDASSDGKGDALGRLQAVLATVLVLAIVVGAAIRAPVVPEDVVPGIASGVLAFAFGVLILQALVALAPDRRERA